MNDDNLKTGYVKLYRSIQEHWIWNDPEMRMAWIDLILLARGNPQPKQITIKGRVFDCLRGELLRSEETLADRWKWKRSRVHRFLLLLQKSDMIRVRSEQVTSRISIVNYDGYNPLRNESEQTSNSKRTDIEQEANTNNKDIKKEGKESNKETLSRSKPSEVKPLSEFAIKAATWWIEQVQQRKPTAKFVLDKQAEAVDHLLKRGYSEDQIRQVMGFTNNDPFWSDVTISLAGLLNPVKNAKYKGVYRWEFDVLLAKAQEQKIKDQETHE